MLAWGNTGSGNCDHVKVLGFPPLLKRPPPSFTSGLYPPPPLPPSIEVFLLTLLKIPVHQKVAHSLIPSLRTPFIPFTHGVSISYITKNSINSWRDSHRRINFFVPLGLISSSTSRLSNLLITKTSITCGQTYAYPLTNTSVNAYGGYMK